MMNDDSSRNSESYPPFKIELASRVHRLPPYLIRRTRW
jgi:hypothetical protein